MGQEIKIRKNPQKTGKIRKNPEKTGNPHKKIFHFLKDFHSLTPAGVPFPLEQSLILNKSRPELVLQLCRAQTNQIGDQNLPH